MGIYLSYPETDIHANEARNDNTSAVFCGIQGYRRENEDGYLLRTKVKELPGCSFYGVFDGHAGSKTSEYASKNFLDTLLTQTGFVEAVKPLMSTATTKSNSIDASCKENELLSDATKNHNLTSAQEYDLKSHIVKAFQLVDAECLLMSKSSTEQCSGSTATCVFVLPSHLIFANLGDSRSILINSASNCVFETKDHKPSNPEEHSRIVNAGGRVDRERINGALAVSRGLGDIDYKSNSQLDAENQMVSSIPDITIIRRDLTNHKYLVLACDGIWDVVSSEQLSTFVSSHMDLTNSDLNLTAQRSVFGALSLGSFDNICMICVSLKSKETTKKRKVSKADNSTGIVSPKKSTALDQRILQFNEVLTDLKNECNKVMLNKDFTDQTHPIQSVSHMLTKEVISSIVRVGIFDAISGVCDKNDRTSNDACTNIQKNVGINDGVKPLNPSEMSSARLMNQTAIQNDSHWFYKDVYDHLLTSISQVLGQNVDSVGKDSDGVAETQREPPQNLAMQVTDRQSDDTI
ncbi:MAG: Protein phosphatase 1B [Marteilia pararefringens]